MFKTATMVSAVQKLLSIAVFASLIGFHNNQSIGRFLIQPLVADTVQQETKTTDDSKQSKPGSGAGFISLERRMERDVNIIKFKHYDPLDTIESTNLQHDQQNQSFQEQDSGLTLSRVNRLIQKISLDKDTYQQGEIANLDVTAVLPLESPKINFLHKTYKLYPQSHNIYRTILAVPMQTEPGKYYMTLSYKEEGKQKTLQMPFTVIPGNFSEEDTAELDISILTEETFEMLKYEGNYFARAYNTNPDSLLYDGDFIWPCSGTITGLYGTPRRYNEDLGKWSHKAVDIANVVGTEVFAANHGVVTMAKNLDVHGKSIVIAHGQGIHTVYIHLDSICVEKGDEIKKGQLIGKLGKTGLCTGPNLHWQVMVNRVAINPRYWLEGKPELKEKQWVQYKQPEK